MLGTQHGSQVIVFFEIADRLATRRGPAFRNGQRATQLPSQFLQAHLRLLPGIGLRRIGIHNQINLAGQGIDHGQFFRLQQEHIGHADFVRLVEAGQFIFDIANRVIAKITGQTAAKTREACGHMHLETRLVICKKIQRIALPAFDHVAIAQHIHIETMDAQHITRGQADEGIASEAFTTDHGLKQKTVWLIRQLEVDRQRRIKIGESFQRDRNAVVTSGGQALELCGFGFRGDLHDELRRSISGKHGNQPLGRRRQRGDYSIAVRHL